MIDLYTHQSLAACGFVVLHSDVAMLLRPDLWPDGSIVCAGEISRGFARNQFAAVPHAVRLTARLAGIERPVPVLARSVKRLAERIEEVTGLPVLEIVEGETIKTPEEVKKERLQAALQRHAAAPIALATPPRREQRTVPPDVDGLDIAAKELARPCTACGNRTGDGGCLPAIRGEFPGRPAHFKPTADHLRRCLHYAPGHEFLTGEHRDLRTGLELWPELLSAKAQATSPTTQHEGAKQASASGKARDLLAAMLKSGPRNASEIRTAAEGAGISERTMQAIAESMGVVKSKAGMFGGWVWALPEGARAAV